MMKRHSTLWILVRILFLATLFLVCGTARAEIWIGGQDIGYGDTEDWYGRWWVDIDGNGRSDYCRLVGDQGRMLSCTLSELDGQFVPVWGRTIVFDGIAQGVAVTDKGTRRWADIDGDGIQEYCAGHFDFAVACYRLDIPTAQFAMTAYIELDDRGDKEYLDFADVNADGRSDLCVMVSYGLRCYLSNGAGFDTTPRTVENFDRGYKNRARGWFDYNGDGYADYCRMVGGDEWRPHIRCTVSGADGFVGEIESQQLGAGGFPEGSAFTDVNGDGKIDYCFVLGDNNLVDTIVRCRLGTGAPPGPAWSGFHFPESLEIDSGVLDRGYAEARWWVDINGDGMADYCRSVNGVPTGSQSRLSCRLFSGTGFATSDVLSSQLSFGESGGRSFCDADGNGILELCRVGDGAIHAGLKDPYDPNVVIHAQPQLLQKLTDGLGATTHITYRPLTDPRIYTRDGTSRWPDQLLVQPTTLAVYDTDARRSDGRRLTGRSLYHYRNMRTDTQGHGSRGFEERRMLNQGNNTLDRVFYYQGLERGVASTPEISRQAMLDVGQTRAKEIYVMETISIQEGWKNWEERLRAPAPVATGSTEPAFPNGRLVQWVKGSLPRDTVPANPGYRYSDTSEDNSWDLNGSTRVAMPRTVVLTTQDHYGNITQLVRMSLGPAIWSESTTNEYDQRQTLIDNWILGRLLRAKVANSVPLTSVQLGLYPSSAGSAQYASDATVPLPSIGGMGVVIASRPNPGTVTAGSPFSVTGGMPPYAYSWSRVSGSRITFSPADAASTTFTAALPSWGESVTERFELTVTDATGRSVSRPVDVTMSTPSQLVLSAPASVSASRPSPGAASASASPSATGGVAPYSYAWTRLTGSRIAVSGGSPATFSASVGWSESLTESFRVTVTDGGGNTASRDVSVTFTTPAQLLISAPASLSATRTSPGIASVSTAAPTASGGTPPYTFQWTRISGSRSYLSASNPPTLSADLGWAENFTETWRITVVDAANATVTHNVSVSFSTPAQLLSSISPGSVTASRIGSGSVSASATVGVSGGTPGYSYAWARETGSVIGVSGGQTATFSASLSQGQSVTERFRVTVTDTAGVQTSAAVDVTLTAIVPLAVSASPASPSGTRTGSGTVSASTTLNPAGGVPPYSYGWSRLSGSAIGVSGGQQATFSANVNVGQSYTERFRGTVTDSTGASTYADVAVTLIAAAPPMSISLSPSYISVTTQGTATRETTVSVSGGLAPFSFAWTKVGGSGGNVSVSGGQTASFTGYGGFDNGCEPAPGSHGVFRVTVTDATSQVATAEITVRFNPARPTYPTDCP